MYRKTNNQTITNYLSNYLIRNGWRFNAARDCFRNEKLQLAYYMIDAVYFEANRPFKVNKERLRVNILVLPELQKRGKEIFIVML